LHRNGAPERPQAGAISQIFMSKARVKYRPKADFFFLNQALAAYRQNGAAGKIQPPADFMVTG
jgi:hypothetical protein